jgi:hypothetical protein
MRAFKSIKAPLRVIEATLLFFFSKKAEAFLKGLAIVACTRLDHRFVSRSRSAESLLTPVSTHPGFTQDVSFLRTQYR